MKFRASIRSVLLAGLASGALAVAACVGNDPDLDAENKEDSGPSSSDAGPSLAAQSDFEATGCLGWETNEATKTLDEDEHSGVYSCRVCSAPGAGSSWALFQKINGLPAGGYKATAFVRASGDAGPFNVSVRLDVNDDYVDGPGLVVPGGAWVPVSVERSIASGEPLTVGVVSGGELGCFLVDDLVLTKVQ